MCGIAGFCNLHNRYLEKKGQWEDILNRMNRVQKHRGPDDQGTFLENGCGLAHVRLSIIDLYTGHQPMVREESGRKFVIVYNGEIYNMKELKQELKKEGAIFRTASDTEVILEGYILHGPAFVEKLNGIFAVSIWDSAEKKLFLFRDRLGGKPLYFHPRSRVYFSTRG